MRHVHTGRDADPLEGPLMREAVADQAEHRHLAVRPLDAATPVGCEAEVGDVVGVQSAESTRGQPPVAP